MSTQPNNESEQLRLQFLASLPQRARQIEDLWHRLRYLSWNEQGAKMFHKMVNRLVTLSANFDLPTINTSAASLDKYLQEHLALDRPLGGIECEIIDQMAVNLSNILNDHEQPSTMLTPQKKPETAKRIFVVDSDCAFAAIVATYLRASGFQVQQFDTTEKCMLHVFTEQPHAILMDVGLHGDDLDGLKSIEYIKNQFGIVVPIILLSTRTDMQARLRSLRAGCTDYLTKPINYLYLVERISMAISSHSVKHKVMIINNDEATAKHYADILHHASMKTIHCANPLQSLQFAIKCNPDLVIIDIQTEDINAVEIATLLHQEDQFCVLPILFITADISTTEDDTYENVGISDVLKKPVAEEVLIHACQRAIKNSIALKNRIAKVAQHTPNNINHCYFFGAIESEIKQQAVRRLPTALYYIGLDVPASLQEEYGQTGLAIIHQQFCELMTKIIDTEEQWSDTSTLVACVLTGQHSHEHHLQRTAQIIEHLNALTYQVQGKSLTLHSQIGISYLHAEIESTNSALWYAEQSYIKAVTHAHKLQPALSVKEQLQEQEYVKLQEPVFEFDFKHELPTKNLMLLFQPIVNPEKNTIENHEVLVRWNSDAHAMIPAATFLQYIEQSFMRVELDRWVLQAAVTAMTGTNDTREYATLFIHLSEDTLAQKSFFSFTANVFRSSRLRGEQRLIFILKEKWVNDHLKETAEIIEALNNIHCGVCLTRAGDTDASENILNSFNFHFTTLSPHLTANMENDTAITSRLKHIIATATKKGTQVIAVQLEDLKNVPPLWRLGVKLFQGFFIQSPKQQFNMHADTELTKQMLPAPIEKAG